MKRADWVRVAASTATVAVCLSACIAPDVDVIGALGVTVDDQGRPVLVVEPCEGAAILVTLSFNREGLSDDEENETLGSWTAAEPTAEMSELVLSVPSAPWHGVGVDLPAGRGYIAGGQGHGDKQVLTQVAFDAGDLAEMKPGNVYRNHPDPDVTALVARSPAEFSAEVCGRG